MINNKDIATYSKEIKKPYKCRNCYVIRLFLLAVIFIVIFALIQNDNLHYLDFVMFLIKVTKYIFERKRNKS